MSTQLNLFSMELKSCNQESQSFCKYFYTESGFHIVCILVTKELIQFYKKRGLDLNKINNNILSEGDKCCICVYKWVEAYHAGIAPKIVAESTSIEILKHVPMEILKNFII